MGNGFGWYHVDRLYCWLFGQLYYLHLQGDVTAQSPLPLLTVQVIGTALLNSSDDHQRNTRQKNRFSGTFLLNLEAGDGRISGMSEKYSSSMWFHHPRTGFIFLFNHCWNLKHSKLIFINNCHLVTLSEVLYGSLVWSIAVSTVLDFLALHFNNYYIFLKFWHWLYMIDQ